MQDHIFNAFGIIVIDAKTEIVIRKGIAMLIKQRDSDLSGEKVP